MPQPYRQPSLPSAPSVGSEYLPQSPRRTDDPLQQALNRMTIQASLQRNPLDVPPAPLQDQFMPPRADGSAHGSSRYGQPCWRSQSSLDGSANALAPLFDMLSKRRARVYPEGVKHHARVASVAGITRIYFEPCAAHGESNPKALHLSQDDLQLLGNHMGTTPSLQQLDMVLCTFETPAMTALLRNLRHLQRLSVRACSLNALGLSYLLHNLPATIVALDASGNDLSGVAKNSGNALLRLSSKKRNSDSGEVDVSGLARLSAMTELRLQRCSLHGNAIAALGRSIQACTR